MAKFKALVVDDSFIMVKKIKSIVEDMSIEVVSHAKTGKQAIIEYKRFQPDLVTMDITMPDMNGIEATKRIIEYDPDAIIIMITSHGQQLMVLDAIKAGAKGYVLKPLNGDKIKETILSVLVKKK